MIHWNDHTQAGVTYPLSHLHPFSYVVPLPATPIRTAHDVTLHVSFSLHTFTRGFDPDDPVECHYRDSREIRAFDPVRYHHSLLLPQIMRTLQHRRCEFAKDKNGVISYVTIELDNCAQYAAFFDLPRRAKLGPYSRSLLQICVHARSRQAKTGKGKNYSMRADRPCVTWNAPASSATMTAEVLGE